MLLSLPGQRLSSVLPHRFSWSQQGSWAVPVPVSSPRGEHSCSHLTFTSSGLQVSPRIWMGEPRCQAGIRKESSWMDIGPHIIICMRTWNKSIAALLQTQIEERERQRHWSLEKQKQNKAQGKCACWDFQTHRNRAKLTKIHRLLMLI